jgi:hypothetical protein
MAERIAGKKGVKVVTHRPDTYLDLFRTGTPNTVVTASSSWDQTRGIKELFMLGNGPDSGNPPYYPDGVGDCVPVSVQNGRLFQSLTGTSIVNGVVTATFVPNFRRPHTAWVLNGRYFPYGVAMGEQGQPPAPVNKPDEGSDPTTYADWVVSQDAEVEFSAEIDVSDAVSNPEGVLLRIKQAAVDFDGVAICVNLCPNNENEFNLGQPWTVGAGNAPDPNEGHGVWIDAFTPTHAQVATWGFADQLVTNEWLTQCITSCRVYGTKSQAEQAGYNFAAWEAVAKTYPGYASYPVAEEPIDETEPVAGIMESPRDLLQKVEEAMRDIPEEFKAAVKILHKVMDAAMERESVAVVEKLLADFLAAYLKVP